MKAPPSARSTANPYGPHTKPDYNRTSPDLRRPTRRIQLNDKLPRAKVRRGQCVPQWNSVALFFNLDLPAGATPPKGYKTTTVQSAKTMLDEGTDPVAVGVSEYLCNYWRTVSRGKLAFGLNTPRNTKGQPLVPTLAVPSGGTGDWGALIKAALNVNADQAWKASGSLMLDGKRWIPSVVLMQNYDVGASAFYGSFDHTVAGVTYTIGDRTHIRATEQKWAPPEAPGSGGRKWWGTLLHEYAHNFVEFGDLYGPQGCTGYWDLLGDSSPPGRTSELSSIQKERMGWIAFKKVISGPTKPVSLSLSPFTTTGEAIKVVPDPVNTPNQYFVLEFRKSTGSESWRPDGALSEAGLLITHINDRIGIPTTWINRDSPFFDPEFGDGSDKGATDWTGNKTLNGMVFPQGSKNRFTPTSTPSSNFYGGRKSGLHVTDIKVSGGKVSFKLMISGTQSQVGWVTSAADRGLAGRFTPTSKTQGQEIFFRNDDNAAVLQNRQSQWMVKTKANGWVGKWNLGAADREAVGDLDGDGFDEIWIRSAGWAGVLEYKGQTLRSTIVTKRNIGRWVLAADDWEHVGDLDGDGKDEVYLRRANAAGVVDFFGCPAKSQCSKPGTLTLASMHTDAIGAWTFGANDKELVGHFRTTNKEDVAIFNHDDVGLLGWSSTSKKLTLVKVQKGSVGGWNLGPADKHYVGDFDGDGLDEVYVRSASWAGLLEWSGGKFVVKWMTKGPITGAKTVPLAATDRSYPGRFRIDRDAIVQRAANGIISMIVWDGTAMTGAERTKKSKLNGKWTVASGDGWITGDFHGKGGDVIDVGTDYATDDITDIFMHSGAGTAMLGYNPRKVDPVDWKDRRYGLVWHDNNKLLRTP
ncbi:MAG: VCBS repeat-containing protein [Myxococcota bacterium]